MPTTFDDLLSHAEKLAADLELDMQWKPSSDGYSGFWSAPDGRLLLVIRARANRAIAFLQQHAGDQSHWTHAARSVLQSSGENQSMESGARGVGVVLRQWIEEVRAGYATPHTADAIGARAVASTDLMEQVRSLINDARVHPAAPIVLAAAALEMALRSASEELALPAPDQASLHGYTVVLQKAGVLNRQDVKEITQIAGVRNSAAHGSFEELSRERAGLLEQQVNFMLSRLPDKVAAAVPI